MLGHSWIIWNLESCNILYAECLRARQEGPQQAAVCTLEGLGAPAFPGEVFCDEYRAKEIKQVSLAGFLQILQRYYFCTWQGATESRDGVRHGSDTNFKSENARCFFFCTKVFMECKRLWVQTVPQIILPASSWDSAFGGVDSLC